MQIPNQPLVWRDDDSQESLTRIAIAAKDEIEAQIEAAEMLGDCIDYSLVCSVDSSQARNDARCVIYLLGLLIWQQEYRSCRAMRRAYKLLFEQGASDECVNIYAWAFSYRSELTVDEDIDGVKTLFAMLLSDFGSRLSPENRRRVDKVLNGDRQEGV